MSKTIYQIVYGESITIIENKVNSMLKEGWKLRGGISALPTHFLQSMTKKADPCGNCFCSKPGYVKTNLGEWDICPICHGEG